MQFLIGTLTLKTRTMIRNILCVIAVCAMTAESSAFMINRTRRSADTCGVPKTQLGMIIRGQTIDRGTFPWIVALMHTETIFCAGTLISKTFVISAAHCILNKGTTKKLLSRDILAIFGAHDVNNAYEAGRIIESPKKIFIHDDWNHLTESYDADVSLLEFWANKIHFGSYIQPICLWSSEDEPTVTETGLVAGWGKTENPLKTVENKPKVITAPIQPQEECFFDAKHLLGMSSLRTFCAGLRNGSGICAGDSGGGLFIKANGVYHLKGIVSSSLMKDSNCDVSNNAIYTNVPKFFDWIKRKTGGAIASRFVPVSITQALASKSITCNFYDVVSANLKRKVVSCYPQQVTDSEAYVLDSPVYTIVEQLYINNNRKVRYLPKQIGERFPYLEDFWVKSCGVKLVREHHFNGMRNLRYLTLTDNEIATIEPKSFRDLISVERLLLRSNYIKTLDMNLLDPMVNLELIDLAHNKINSLNLDTFAIPGGKLELVDLRDNVCIDKIYGSSTWGWNNMDKVEPDLRTMCAQ